MPNSELPLEDYFREYGRALRIFSGVAPQSRSQWGYRSRNAPRSEDLERFLERGDELGFVKQTDDPGYLGWILLIKRKPHERYLSLLAPGEEPEFVAEQELLRRRPYQVQVIELNREVFESGRDEREEDYRVNEVHYFSNLERVEEFVQTFGETLENIKWPIDIKPP